MPKVRKKKNITVLDMEVLKAGVLQDASRLKTRDITELLETVRIAEKETLVKGAKAALGISLSHMMEVMMDPDANPMRKDFFAQKLLAHCLPTGEKMLLDDNANNLPTLVIKMDRGEQR